MDVLINIWNHVIDFAVRYVAEPIRTMDLADIADILLLAAALFLLYRYFRNRRAGRVLVGLTVIIICSVLACLLELPALSYIAKLFATAAFFSVVVIFQPEIRDALEKLGNATVFNPGSDSIPRRLYPLAKSVAEETVDAVCKMSESSTGALIVFEGLTRLGDSMETGKIVDARVTSHLLQNLFFDKAPLHDGAVIIRDMRIRSASCVLPSTRSKMDFGNMGTRHRAAVGITEVSDALVVVVSEQTGIISVAQDGKLLRHVDRETLYDILMSYLAGRAYLRVMKQEAKKKFFARFESIETKLIDEQQNSAPRDAVEEEPDDDSSTVSVQPQDDPAASEETPDGNRETEEEKPL